MPSGGYGPGTDDDAVKIKSALKDQHVRRYGLQVEWLNAYLAARLQGAEPDVAAAAAYEEWDL